MVPVYDGVWRIVSASGEGYSLALRNDSSVQREVRMNWRVTFLILMSSLSVFPFSGQAHARCELAPANGGRSYGCGGGSAQRQSSGADAAALLGLGIAILNALPEPEDRPVQTFRPRSSDNIDRMSRAFGRAGAIANAASTPDPRPSVQRPIKNGQAPYANDDCVAFKQRSRGRIDWDYVDVINKCNIPVQVVMCYYMLGDERKCAGKSAWGTTSTIGSRGKTVSVSDTRSHPYKVKYFVCDMSGVRNNSKLCLRPTV